jgi:hypothetical protein
LAGLVAGAALLVAVPRLALACLTSVTAAALASLSLVGRPGRFEGLSMIAVALVAPLLLLLVVELCTRSKRAIGLIIACSAIGAADLVRADARAIRGC